MKREKFRRRDRRKIQEEKQEKDPNRQGEGGSKSPTRKEESGKYKPQYERVRIWGIKCVGIWGIIGDYSCLALACDLLLYL